MTTGKGRRITLLSGIALVVVLAVVAWASWGELRAWYLLRRDFESLGTNAQGYSEYRHRQTGIIFVKLPGGEFWMGTSKEEGEGLVDNLVQELGEDQRKWIAEAISREQPQHRVTLSPFLIAKFELSQAEWLRVMGSVPSFVKEEDLPVVGVSWNDCKAFCERTGLALPTEAQWEYACRAGTSTLYSFGETITYNQAHHSGDGTAVVDSGEPNGFGLLNVHGNVLEWCEDVYNETFYSQVEARRPDPVCTSGSQHRVARGGYWKCGATDCRSAARFGAEEPYYPYGLRPTYGLR